jgi:hypothetical protein
MNESETKNGVGEKHEQETVMEALTDMLFGQWVSMLLIFSPLALASHFLEWDAKYTFWLWCVYIVCHVVLLSCAIAFY